MRMEGTSRRMPAFQGEEEDAEGDHGDVRKDDTTAIVVLIGLNG